MLEEEEKETRECSRYLATRAFESKTHIQNGIAFIHPSSSLFYIKVVCTTTLCDFDASNSRRLPEDVVVVVLYVVVYVVSPKQRLFFFLLSMEDDDDDDDLCEDEEERKTLLLRCK